MLYKAFLQFIWLAIHLNQMKEIIVKAKLVPITFIFYNTYRLIFLTK